MNTVTRVILTVPILVVTATAPVAGQDALGTNFGIPNSSPPILWPRGMSIESLSPNNLYPNGSQFGLSTTAGGFGTSGSGPVSGVGLAQRSVSPLVQQELQSGSSYVTKLTALETAEALRSRTVLSTVLGSQFRSAVSTPVVSTNATSPIVAPIVMPSVDAVLHDRFPSTDAILQTGP